ncbi:MAG: type IV pilus secretin family protein [Gammaproteobacteria bacterium]|nr:MAG: type IV pilus secretin family protein [Gammaproteobacteria bacterium]
MTQRDMKRYGAMTTGRLLLAALLAFATQFVCAGEIRTLSWESDGASPVLRVQVVGETTFEAVTLEHGQRLRVSFLDSTLATGVAEPGGQGLVKGVYPYLTEGGGAVNVDLLLTEPGQMEVRKVADGYRVAVLPAGATRPAATPTESEKPVTVAVPPPADTRVTIEEMAYARLPGDRIQVTLRMSKPPSEPQSFTITNPARISLDFAGTRLSTTSKTLAVKEGALMSVTAIPADDRTRVVLSLVKSVSYSTAIEGNTFVVTLDPPATAVAGAEPPKTTRFASSRRDARFSLKDIDFRRGPQGDGKVIVTLSDPTVGIDVREQAGEILLDFQNTSVPSELQRRLDVVDFATPVQTIDTFSRDGSVRMVIAPKGKYEHVAYQAGNVFTVSVKPILEKEGEKKADEFGYTGEKLSLNFQNIDVRAALQVLADFTGLNFIISDTVRGNMTLRLKDVPWDQALDLIVDNRGLAVRRKGNVVTVAPAAEVAAKEKAQFEAAKAAVELEPLVSELIQVNYAKADDIAALLKSIKALPGAAGQLHPVFGTSATGNVPTVQAATESNTLLSPRGQVTVDARTNSLLIQDTPGKIREVRKLISQLDQPIRQVMIESRLVEATDNFSRSIGARLGHRTSAGAGVRGNNRVVTTGQLDGVVSTLNNTTFEIFPSGLNVNLPSPGIGSQAAGVFSIAIQSGLNLLDLELSALEQEGKGKIVSSPRIVTANQKKATIEQGQERVFTTSVLGVGSVVTKKATLKLDVTPQITPDDRVNLEVVINKDNFADATAGLLNVKQITTSVLLDNGETVVIGGIYEQDRNDTVTQVPFLGDIPLLGWLFKNKEFKDNKTELLIFLTPRILSQQTSLR